MLVVFGVMTSSDVHGIILVNKSIVSFLQVKICEMQVRGAPRDLQPGDPLCAPTSSIMVEAHIALLRSLHRQDSWRDSINSNILSRLGLIKKLHQASRVDDASMETSTKNTKDKRSSSSSSQSKDDESKKDDKSNYAKVHPMKRAGTQKDPEFSTPEESDSPPRGGDGDLTEMARRKIHKADMTGLAKNRKGEFNDFPLPLSTRSNAPLDSER